jgi:hypothetical protein
MVAAGGIFHIITGLPEPWERIQPRKSPDRTSVAPYRRPQFYRAAKQKLNQRRKITK